MRRTFFLMITMLCMSIASTYAQEEIVKNFKTDFGAKGDGKTDDSEAWNNVILHFNQKKKGVLIIPEGIYRIGKQKFDTNPTNDIHYAKPKYNPILTRVDGLTIKGTVKNGKVVSVFKYLDNLKYGFYNPEDGKEAKNVKNDSQAYVGAFLIIDWSCSNITIKDLELDGNSLNAQYQKAPERTRPADLGYDGIVSYAPQNLIIQNVYAHHFGLDGFYIETTRIPRTDNKNHALLENVRSEYNGRQGLSFTAGSNLKVINSSFKYTGMAGISIPPCANVDIENHDPTGTPLSNTLFKNCVISSNKGGSGSVNIAGKVNNIRFENCTIDAGEKIPNTNRIYAVQMNFSPSRNVSFEKCTITGIFLMYNPNKTMDSTGLTTLKNCIIKDNDLREVIPVTQPLIDVYDKVQFDQCTFYLNPARTFIRSSPLNKVVAKRDQSILFRNCKFNDKKTNKKMVNFTKKVPDNIRIQ